MRTEDAAKIPWVKRFSEAMRPHAMTGAVRQLPGRDDGDPPHRRPLRSTVPEARRLMAVKRQYDPENLLRINHNIPPDA